MLNNFENESLFLNYLIMLVTKLGITDYQYHLSIT